MEAFSVAYVTPGTPAYHNATESWLAAVDPLSTRETAARGGSRYLRNSYVQERLARAALGNRQMTALSAEEYAVQCLENEKMLLDMASRGVKGAATAAARYRELAGKSLQLLVTRTRDDTPRPQLALPRTPEELAQLRNGLDLLLQLNEPNPVPAPPQLRAGTSQPSEAVADYEVLETTSNETETSTGSADRAPDGTTPGGAGDVGSGPADLGRLTDPAAEEIDAL
jgi:hypothetical protein